MERVLVIGAHCDDESFGCLGTLLEHKKAGDVFGFLAFTEARQTLFGWKKVTKYFKREYERFGYLIDQRLDTFAIQDITRAVEEAVASFRPTVVYCPFIGDLNRDHRIVAEATMVACRPYKPNAPKELWMYAISGTTELGLRMFQRDKAVKVDKALKESLIREWYTGETINGRENVSEYEYFESWPIGL